MPTTPNTVVLTAPEAVRAVRPGMAVMLGGFSVGQGWPATLLRALAAHGADNLTIIANSMGYGAFSPQILAERGLVSRFIGSFGGFPGRRSVSEEQILAGMIDFEIVPQGTLVERIRAAGAGISAFYTPTGVGTVVETPGQEVRRFHGRPHLLATALPADVALLRATVADAAGNLQCAGTHLNFNVAMATAATTVIAEVERIVPLGGLAAEDVDVPGIYVDAVVAQEIPQDEILADALAGGRDPLRPSGDSSPLPGIPRDLMALRAARLIVSCRYVNLGIGLPTLVGLWLDEIGADVQLHAENGLLGYRNLDDLDRWNPAYYNAGGQPVEPLPGSATFDSSAAFAMARGGHLDAVVLGAFQVSRSGDLANWRLPGRGVGGIGGAMDLIAGAARVVVVMEHVTPSGEPRLLEECTFPLTGRHCVDSVVTNLALIDVQDDGLLLRELAPGVTPQMVRAATGCPIRIPPAPPVMAL